MKTAISIPDSIFYAAEEAAQRLSLSRSELYARAVEEFLAKQRREAVTERLNAVYGDEPSALDPALAEMQRRSLGSDVW